MTKYYLIDPDGYVSSIFEIKKVDSHYADGDCYTVNAWDGEKIINGVRMHMPFDGEPMHYLAGVYCKWDACTHWYFLGEDHDPDPEGSSDGDSYYHICGARSFMEHIREMCFVWKVCGEIICEFNNGSPYTYNAYFEEVPGIKDLINTMLTGYRIVKVEEE